MRAVMLSWVTALTVALTGVHAADAPTPTAEAHALFDDYWNWLTESYPDIASLYFGDGRYAHRLRDESTKAVLARNAAFKSFLDRAERVDEAGLQPIDRVSLRVLRYRLETGVAIVSKHGGLPFGAIFGDTFAPLTSTEGLHLLLPELGQASSFASVGEYEAWLKRLEQVPASIAGLIDRMQSAIDAGWMPARAAISGVPQQLQAYLAEDLAKNPAYRPFLSFAPGIDPSERRRLEQAGQRLIREQVTPAFRSLKTFYETRYLPAARESGALSSLPAGMSYYRAWLKWYTTTDLTPQQIHDLGLTEVARVGSQMDAVVAETGFKGTRAEFQKFLTGDPRFFHVKAEDMLAGYRDIAKRADAALPQLFAELPRQTYGVRAMPPETGDASEHYTPGADGRPGWFEANVNNLPSRPKWQMESLLLHEAVPGHHLQSSRQREIRDLPTFRRYLWFAGFGEGWALYAESLGYEMGFYKDPYQRFGNLSLEMLRACRLVVDTGLHAFGWNRQQAIDYLVANTGQTVAVSTAQVDRYLLTPGQAAAYKIGELQIKALRAKAKAALGERFDLRRFHNAVIDNGALPLQILERQIDEWIESERAATGR